MRILQELVYTRYASGHPLGCPLFPGISRNFRELSFKKIFFSKFVRFFRKKEIPHVRDPCGKSKPPKNSRPFM